MALPTHSNYQPWGTLPVQQTCFKLFGTKRTATQAENTNGEFASTIKRHCLKATPHRTPDHHPTPPPAAPPSSPGQAASQSHRSSLPENTAAYQHKPIHFETTDSGNSMQISQGHLINDSCNVHRGVDARDALGNSTLGVDNWSQSSGNLQRHHGIDESQQRTTTGANDARHEEISFESNDYWDVPCDHHLLKMADEVEQARIAMEMDFVQNHHQHGCTKASESALLPGLESRVTSSKVRRFCKPTWEGLLEPISYI